MKNKETLHSLLRFLDTISYVKPEQIPDIDLYMDQVTSFMEDHLKKVKRYPEDKVLTKTMINNYTKAKILPPPEKKKYSREHMYMLLFIYYYKGILSLGDLNTVLSGLEGKYFRLEYSQMMVLKEDILQKFKSAEETFQEGEGPGASLSPEDREELRLFSFISELAFDVYLKKLLIEKLCDQIAEERPANNKRKGLSR